MFDINKEDKTISVTRGDVAHISFGANRRDGSPYTFVKDDVVRFKIIEKNKCDKVLLKKDVSVPEESTSVLIVLESSETRFCSIIHKPVDYWYEIELNPDTPRARTIIGYDKLGPKIFRLYPEGSDENAE